MRAEMNAPKFTTWPLTVNPRPLVPPPPAAFTSGVMMLSVNALIRVLNASATTRPTAMTIRLPCIRKLLNPFSMVFSFRRSCRPRRAARAASQRVVVGGILVVGSRVSQDRDHYDGSAGPLPHHAARARTRTDAVRGASRSAGPELGNAP